MDVKAIGGALRRAERNGYIDKDPVPAAKLPKAAASTEREVFTLDEIHRLVKAPDEDSRNFARRTFHSLRHTFSSMLATRSVSEELRMRLTGHSSRDTHQRYALLNTDTLQRAIDTIPAKSPVG